MYRMSKNLEQKVKAIKKAKRNSECNQNSRKQT